MKKVRNLLLVLLAAVLCLLLLTGCGEKDVTVSVTLVNRSGREISSISITLDQHRMGHRICRRRVRRQRDHQRQSRHLQGIRGPLCL